MPKLYKTLLVNSTELQDALNKHQPKDWAVISVIQAMMGYPERYMLVLTLDEEKKANA